MEFSRLEFWSELPFSAPGDLPDPGTEPRSLALQADSLWCEPPGKPKKKHGLKLSLLFFRDIRGLSDRGPYSSAAKRPVREQHSTWSSRGQVAGLVGNPHSSGKGLPFTGELTFGWLTRYQGKQVLRNRVGRRDYRPSRSRSIVTGGSSQNP